MIVSDEGLYLPAKALGDQLERELQSALNHYWPTGWTQQMFAKYCQRLQVPGDEAETFYIDGKPMLRIYPMKQTVIGKKLRMTQQVDRLY
jgi:hypothetical protein